MLIKYTVISSSLYDERQELIEHSVTKARQTKIDAARKWSRFLCPHLWWNKWVLICNTLPEDHMIPEMRRCYQELLRRFGQKHMVERNYHSVGVAHICGGVVGDETYARWPISNWLNSF